MDDEARLRETLERIESLFLGATTPGERQAAANARERVRARLEELGRKSPPVEHQFSMGDMWSRKLFVALLRRYGIKPYRYYRQRYTTVMARVPKQFLDETLWPEFIELDGTLRSYLAKVTDRLIAEAVHEDGSEAEVLQQLLESSSAGGSPRLAS